MIEIQRPMVNVSVNCHYIVLSSLRLTETTCGFEREMVYLYMKKRSEDTVHSAVTEERIAKVVAAQVEKRLAR